jgi:hypothetical protein
MNVNRAPSNILDRPLDRTRYVERIICHCRKCSDWALLSPFSVHRHKYLFLIFDRSSDGNVSLSAFAYIYSELVQYHQGRAASISELERRLESAGYGVGLKVLELVAYRAKEVRICKL